MLNSALFHSQIASIVEVLAKTAVAEICQLVDNGYAALQMEISRSQKENKALKRELHMSKLRLAQEARDLPQASANNAYKRAQVCDKIKETARRNFPEEHEFESVSAVGRWEDGDQTFIFEDDSVEGTTMKNKAVYAEDPLLIKEERLEEDFRNRKQHGRLKIGEQGASGTDLVELPGPCGMGADPQRTTADTELGPYLEERSGDGLCSPGSHDEKPDVIMIEAEGMELQFRSAWTEEAESGEAESEHKRYVEEEQAEQGNFRKKCAPQEQALERQGTASYGTIDMTGAISYEGESSDTYLGIDASGGFTGGGPYCCLMCPKTFVQLMQWKKHQSVHKGKETLTCVQCGKCFANSSNLKRHQTVHTGERPFSCKQCGKRFSFVGNLKRHQSVHIRDKPSSASSAMWESV